MFLILRGLDFLIFLGLSLLIVTGEGFPYLSSFTKPYLELIGPDEFGPTYVLKRFVGLVSSHSAKSRGPDGLASAESSSAEDDLIFTGLLDL